MGDMTIEEARRTIGNREVLVDYMHDNHREAYAAHPDLSTEAIAVEVMCEQAAKLSAASARPRARWFDIPGHQRAARIGQIEDQLSDVRHDLSAEDIEAAEALIDLAKGI